jgi:hypothetical protein
MITWSKLAPFDWKGRKELFDGDARRAPGPMDKTIYWTRHAGEVVTVSHLATRSGWHGGGSTWVARTYPEGRPVACESTAAATRKAAERALEGRR